MSNVKRQGFEAEFVSYKNGQQKYLRINLSDLKIHLRDFKSAVISTDISGLGIGVLGLWLPLITSDFRDIYWVGAGAVQGAYTVVAIILTCVLIKRVFNKVRKQFSKSKLPQHQTDPDSLAEDLYNAMPDEKLT